MNKPPYSMQVCSPAVFAGTAADEVLAAISDLQAEHPTQSISLALAGGGTPVSIYKSLAVPPRSTSVDWKKVNFFFGDERWVPHEDPQSNFRMSYEALLKPLNILEKQIFSVDTTIFSIAEAAQNYEATLRQSLSNGTFDLILLGMGDDGHTASIFPGSPLLNASNSTSLVAAVEHPQTKQPRVTLTVRSIVEAAKVLVLVSGSAKATVLQHILEGTVPKYPIQILESIAEKVTIVADTAAIPER